MVSETLREGVPRTQRTPARFGSVTLALNQGPGPPHRLRRPLEPPSESYL